MSEKIVQVARDPLAFRDFRQMFDLIMRESQSRVRCGTLLLMNIRARSCVLSSPDKRGRRRCTPSRSTASNRGLCVLEAVASWISFVILSRRNAEDPLRYRSFAVFAARDDKLTVHLPFIAAVA